MAVIKHPQHDLPPDLIRGRISGASVEQCNDILVGEFFGADEPAGITGSAHVSASASLTASGRKAVIRAASDSASAAIAAPGRKAVIRAVTDSASASAVVSTKKGITGAITEAASVALVTSGRKGIVRASTESASAAISTSGRKAVVRAITDAASVAIAVSVSKGFVRAITDSVAATLTVLATKSVIRAVTDSALVTVTIVGGKANTTVISLSAIASVYAEGFAEIVGDSRYGSAEINLSSALSVHGFKNITGLIPVGADSTILITGFKSSFAAPALLATASIRMLPSIPILTADLLSSALLGNTESINLIAVILNQPFTGNVISTPDIATTTNLLSGNTTMIPVLISTANDTLAGGI